MLDVKSVDIYPSAYIPCCAYCTFGVQIALWFAFVCEKTLQNNSPDCPNQSIIWIWSNLSYVYK